MNEQTEINQLKEQVNSLKNEIVRLQAAKMRMDFLQKNRCDLIWVPEGDNSVIDQHELYQVQKRLKETDFTGRAKYALLASGETLERAVDAAIEAAIANGPAS